MTLPNNIIMDQATKSYLKRSLILSTAATILIFLAGFVVITIIISHKRTASDPDTLKAFREINKNMIVAKQQQSEELRKYTDSNKVFTLETKAEIKGIHSDINSINKNRDEKIRVIGGYQSPDIISAFSDLERQHKTP